MRNAVFVFALLLLGVAMACAQGELAPSAGSGPLKIGPAPPQSDQLSRPVPDSEGVYSLGPEITVPVLLHAVSAAGWYDGSECDPRVFTVVAVIGVDGRASVGESYAPSSIPCANAAINAIKQSQFQPAKWNHFSVPVRVCLRVPFNGDDEPVPSLVRCRRHREPEVEADPGPPRMKAAPTAKGQEVVQRFGAEEAEPVAPVADEHGVYLVGPGIAPPAITTAVEAAPADAVAGCEHPTLVSAVMGADGTIKVVGVYRIYKPEDKACDNLAIAAIEQSKARPATLNGVAVPVRVCLGVPFGRPVPPVPRSTYCPRDIGAMPLGEADAFLPRPRTKPPVVISAPPPAEYTQEARRKRIEGVVVISMIVNEEGMPTDVQVAKGLGYGLDEVSLDNAKRYRFQPATLEGKAVAYRTSIEVNFSLGN